jgi:hypothetical protein
VGGWWLSQAFVFVFFFKGVGRCGAQVFKLRLAAKDIYNTDIYKITRSKNTT